MLFIILTVFTQTTFFSSYMQKCTNRESCLGKVGEQSSEQFIALQIGGGFKGVSSS